MRSSRTAFVWRRATAWSSASPRCCAGSDSSRKTSTRPLRDVLRRLADADRAGEAAARAGPNLLLLDEPTNHLDLDARNWLEEYLSAYPFAVILVSHDRYFLDTVVTRITDLTLRTLTDYAGNYTKYVEQRDAQLDRLRQAKREQDEEMARVKMFIDRFRYQATKAAQVQSRIKMLEKVVPIEVPPERKRMRFSFPDVRRRAAGRCSS